MFGLDLKCDLSQQQALHYPDTLWTIRTIMYKKSLKMEVKTSKN